jgi:hypothetical protein
MAGKSEKGEKSGNSGRRKKKRLANRKISRPGFLPDIKIFIEKINC